MSDVKLNWSTAKVDDSKLTVDLDGELPSGWKDSFDAVARLLAGSSDWGEVSLKKKSVGVADVSEGSEERLRHFLESVVEQANADHRPDDSERDESGNDADEGEDGDDDRDESAPDAEMSERFRSFAD
ncbi:MAG: hypothetical protein ACXVII_38740 [Solirubrobacteraceae bacterium]